VRRQAAASRRSIDISIIEDLEEGADIRTDPAAIVIQFYRQRPGWSMDKLHRIQALKLCKIPEAG
jgi:hypothetical protein